MIDTAYYLTIFFIFIRLISFLGIISVFFPSSTPKSFKIFFTLIFAYILSSSIEHLNVESITSNYTIIIYMINEIMTGIILGFITNLCFYIFEFAGSLMDMQIGLSMLTMYDPNSKNTTTLLSRIIHWMGILLFFITDSHHVLIKELVASYTIVPIGKTMVYSESIKTVLSSLTGYMVIGLKIAIPIVLIIIITDLTLGLISRTVPQLNIMILGLPLKILVGIGAFLLALPIISKGVIAAFNHIYELYHEVFLGLPFVLIFASEEKTEEATPKKKSEAREKGQVARSKDVGIALTMLACTLVLIVFSGYVGGDLKNDLIHFLSGGFQKEFTEQTVNSNMILVSWRIFKVLIPVVLPIMIAGIVASLIQTGFMFTKEPIKPSFAKLNPLKGLKNMFSKKSALELLKNLGMVIVVGFVGYLFVKDNFLSILRIGRVNFVELGPEILKLVVDIFFRITLILVILAIIDYVIQYKMYNKDLKMSKQEVKEEYKQMEGDPQIKSKIKQKQREIATRRMMQSIPDATVVVTNPTHLAVVLKYEEGKSEAPILVAKGASNVALKIKEIAKDNDVPIIENKPLARMMYKTIEIDDEIPADMYQAVAEILAIVYKMKKHKK